ncbi:MAG: Pr6Pr family membrane protein [Microbacteriaceae bacterium]
MKIFVGLLRLAVAAGVATAIVATFFDTASRATIIPFNFFGFFTMQSNIFAGAVVAVTAVTVLMGRKQSKGLELARACGTTYIALVGIVYNTLLTGLEGGVSLEWANWVLHVAFPIYAVLDWVLFSDRAAQPWKRFWIVLIYPIAWLLVVLVRGATDGWVPYPFLSPAQDGGYATVAIYCVVIALGFAAVGAAVWAISRVRLLKV